MAPLGAPASTGRILLIFARAPRPGEVKTRLARGVGAEEALRIYRRMGRQVVDRVRTGPYRTVLFFDPPGEKSLLTEWLGEENLRFRSQTSGDLGRRMHSAFQWAFRTGGPVCIIGTDAPKIDVGLLEAAFHALERSSGPDAVFGPATDGGYYLVGLRRPDDRLFRDIPWGTATVLEESLRAARETGLVVELLPPLSDVDHPEDIPEEFRS